MCNIISIVLHGSFCLKLPCKLSLQLFCAGKKAEKHFQLDENGEYITVKGDNFWDIAEEYLKNKYKNEPEKFENLTQNEKNKKIYKETLRILFLNGYDIEEINPNDPEGKMRNSLPALQPRIKIKFTQSLNQAA